MLPTKAMWQKALEKRHGKTLQDRFARACVGVCGLGGLGSNIAISLARAGVGKLILIDFDRVDITNLHRQQYKPVQIGQYKTEALKENLLEITPYIEIEAHTERVTEDNIVPLLRGADVICEAFDVPESKAMLVNKVAETMPAVYLVAASGMAGLGPANQIKTRKIANRFYLCGDEAADTASGLNLVSSRVMLCAAHQAHAVLRILANQFET